MSHNARLYEICKDKGFRVSDLHGSSPCTHEEGGSVVARSLFAMQGQVVLLRALTSSDKMCDGQSPNGYLVEATQNPAVRRG